MNMDLPLSNLSWSHPWLVNLHLDQLMAETCKTLHHHSALPVVPVSQKHRTYSQQFTDAELPWLSPSEVGLVIIQLGRQT